MDIQKKSTKRFGRRELHAQARAAVVGGLVLFVLTQLFLRGWIDFRRPELRDPAFEIKYRQFTKLMKQQDDPAMVVFFGSSMSAHGMKADMVEAPLAETLGKPVVAFNFATSGAGPFTHRIYLQRLLRRGIRPTLAVVELSPMIYDTSAAGDMPRFPPYILDRKDRDTVEAHGAEPDFRNEWWQAYMVPIYGHRLTILNQTASLFVPFADRLELWEDMDDHGWRDLKPISSEDHRRVLSLLHGRYAKRFGEYEIAEQTVNDLRALIGLLKIERIPTLLVQMPKGPSLRALYSKERMAPLFDEFQRLSQASGFPIIDAQLICDEDQFVDTFHLNNVGARVLTEFVIREGILPMHRRR